MIAEISKRITVREVASAEKLGAFRADFSLQDATYPNIYIIAQSQRRPYRFRLRIAVADYDALAPRLEVVDDDGALITSGIFPARFQNGWLPFPAHPVLNDPQFLCIQGTRDYYTHPNHVPRLTGRGWAQDSNSTPLSVLIKTISEKFEIGEWA